MIKSHPILRRILISVVLILIVLCYSGYVTNYVSKAAHEDCWATFKTCTYQYDQKLAEYFNAVKSAVSGQVNMAAAESNLKNPALYGKMAGTHTANLLTTLRLYLPDGYAILEDGIHEDVSSLVSYKFIASNRMYFSDPKEDPFNPGKYIIEAFQPIRKGPRIEGMFAAVIHLDLLPQLISTDAFDGKVKYIITYHKDGTVIVDTKHDYLWNVTELQDKPSIQGYSYLDWHMQMKNGEEGVCIFQGDSPKDIIYGYTIPSQTGDFNIAIVANETIVMEKFLKIQKVTWTAFVVEVLAFIIYLIWILFDTSHQVKVVRAAAQKEELEKQQVALEDALNMAKSANRAKTVFLNNMSHDIRTPMNAIIGYTELANNNIKNKEKVQDYLSKIKESSDHLLSLINDILDMSRIESGKMNLEYKYESLTQIIKTLETMIQADLSAKNLEFTIDRMEIQDDTISCDKLRINQVLLNVLSNAIKYTNNNGKISLSIVQKPKVNSDDDTTPYEFRIKDNGIGMSKEFLKNIYEPFTRVKSSTVSGIQGTGLGMSIAKSLVDKMNGTIQIISKEQIGTEVVLNFNFKTSAKAKLAKEEETPEKQYDFIGKKILIVEDNAMNMEIACELLQEMGCKTYSANDGSIAIDMIKTAKKGDYDLILMDIQMPVMNGYETTKTIRSLELSDYNNIPIIAMTANAFAEDRKEALKCGMNEHIPKPLSIPQLKEVMARFLPNN